MKEAGKPHHTTLAPKSPIAPTPVSTGMHSGSHRDPFDCILDALQELRKLGLSFVDSHHGRAPKLANPIANLNV